MTEQENLSLARTVVDALNRHNPAAAASMYAEDCLSIAPGLEVTGRAGIEQVFEGYFTAFPDFHVEALDLVASGDHVVTRYRVTGTHEGDFQGIAATGNAIDLTGATFTTIRDGLAVRSENIFDRATLLMQLGVDSLATVEA